MTDQTLLMFGIGISFIVLAGVYVFFREGYQRGPREGSCPIELQRPELRAARSET